MGIKVSFHGRTGVLGGVAFFISDLYLNREVQRDHPLAGY
jgi:hypothetical protein